MKKLLFFLFFSISLFSVAQTPQGINYQAVAHDASGNPLANQNATIRVGILSSSPTGTIEWEEEHTVTTNDYGLFDLVIGVGTSTGLGNQSAFADINWSLSTHFLKVELDAGSGFELVGTMQFMSVPYALHAETVAQDNVDDADSDPNNELINNVSFSNDTLYISDAGGTTTTYLPTNGSDDQTLIYDNSSQELIIEDGNTVILDVNDADADPNNELITGGTLNGTDLEITDAGGTTTVDLSSLSGTSNWTQNGTDIYNNNAGNIGIGTTNPTNGKLEINTVAGNEIYFNSAGSNTDIFSNGEMRIGTDNNNWLHLTTNNMFRMSFDFLGNAGLGTITPDATLDLVGSFQYDDGNQQAGYVLTSDALGNASWQAGSNDTLSIIRDSDNDTKIQVEESPDEDIIRFDMMGTEYFVMNRGRLESVNNSNNIFFGSNAGNLSTADSDNIAIGTNALSIKTINGGVDLAIGTNALGAYNAAQGQNIAIGYGTLFSHNAGGRNVAIGYETMRDVGNAFDNVAVGFGAAVDMTNGTGNVFVGTNAGRGISSGSQNVIIGDWLNGQVVAASSGNVKIGYRAGINDNSDNKLYIDNSNTASPLIFGDFSSNLLRVNGVLNINSSYSLPSIDGTNGQVMVTDGAGNLSWTNSSDNDWTSGTDVIYNVTDSVGIGTVLPRTKLELYGSSNVTNLYAFNGSPSTTFAIHNDDLTNSNYSSISFSARASNNGNYNSARIAAVNQNHAAGSMTSDLVFMTRNTSNITEAMRITGDDRIGMGTVNPSTDLHLVGSMRIEDGTQAAGNVLTSDANGNASWKPKAVSFFEGMDPSNGTQPIPQGIMTKLQFLSNGSSFAMNDGAGYSNAAYEFQAPVAGVYQFNVNIVFIAGGPSNNFTINLMHSSGNVISDKNGYFTGDANNLFDGNMHVTVHLNAGESVWVETQNFNGTMTFYQGESSFSGHLVYAD